MMNVWKELKMHFKLKKYIAATSLIEIMMIFFIIGIVTAAAVGLSKPKNEYLNKLKVYKAFANLQSAAETITAEGFIALPSDLALCVNRSGTSCSDYAPSGEVPYNSFALPMHATENTYNPDWNNGSVSNYTEGTGYTGLTAFQQNKFKYMQQGLCQRLAYIYQVDNQNVNCASDKLIDDSSLSSQSDYEGIVFTSSDSNNRTPNLQLSNGDAIYISSKLYTELGGSRVVINPSLADGYTCETAATKGQATTLKNSNCYTIAANGILRFPNETRSAITKAVLKLSDKGQLSGVSTNSQIFLQEQWLHNRDYFNVYIDTNGKMTGVKDYSRGPDRLNNDIYMFHVYRDGTVLPAYESGFPQDLLTAKILKKKPVPAQGTVGTTVDAAYYKPYIYNNNTAFSGLYANIPIAYAQCYAGTAGDASYQAINRKENFHGTYYQRYCQSIPAPLDGCIDTNENRIGNNIMCRTVINEPSFFAK